MLLPGEDRHSQHQSEMEGMLMMMMGGRAAEELVFNHFTTGASNDLERSTSIAHKMVCSWGMSKKVGGVYYSADQGEVFLGKDLMRKKNISQVTAAVIDEEVNRIVNDAYRKAMDLLKKHMDDLHRVTERLIQNETIDGKIVLELLGKSSEPEPAQV